MDVCAEGGSGTRHQDKMADKSCFGCPGTRPPVSERARRGRARAGSPPLRQCPGRHLGAAAHGRAHRSGGAAPAPPPPRTPTARLDLPKHGKGPKQRIHVYQPEKPRPTHQKQNTETTPEAGRHPVRHATEARGWRRGPTREQGGTFERLSNPIEVLLKTETGWLALWLFSLHRRGAGLASECAPRDSASAPPPGRPPGRRRAGPSPTAAQRPPPPLSARRRPVVASHAPASLEPLGSRGKRERVSQECSALSQRRWWL